MVSKRSWNLKGEDLSHLEKYFFKMLNKLGGGTVSVCMFIVKKTLIRNLHGNLKLENTEYGNTIKMP